MSYPDLESASVVVLAGLEPDSPSSVSDRACLSAAAREVLAYVFPADVATFVPGFIGIGLIPDSGGSWFIHRLLGFARAFEWMTSNRKLTAAEAHAWGIVSEVVEADSFVARSAELAAEYAARPTRGIGMTKRLFDHAYDATLEQQLELEAELQQAATETADFAEGVQAFLEKREARFSGS